MASEARLERLGRAVMDASVTAQFLELPEVVSYLAGAFSAGVQRCIDERRRGAVEIVVEEEESVEGL